MKRLLVVAAVLAMWISNAGAAIIVSLSGIVADPTPGVWDWTYTAQLQPDQNMRANALTGDFFTIYDVPNFLSANFGASLNPAVTGRSFITSQQTLGFDPPLTNIPDDPNIANITVRLAGGGDVIPNAALGPVTLGALIIRSTSNVPVDANYGALAQAKAGLGDVSNVGSVPVAAIPEAGSATLMLIGVVALGGAVAFRRRQVDRSRFFPG